MTFICIFKYTQSNMKISIEFIIIICSINVVLRKNHNSSPSMEEKIIEHPISWCLSIIMNGFFFH